MWKALILQVLVLLGGLSFVFAGEDAVVKKAGELIDELGGGSWKVREKAQDRLFGLFADKGELVADVVAERLLGTEDPEVKLRLDAVLRRMAPDHVRLGKRGFLGVNLGKSGGQVQVGDEVYYPVDIMGTVPGSVAAEAGMAAGDRLLMIDDIKCSADVEVEALVRYISSRGPGGSLRLLTLTRDRKVKAMVVKLRERLRQSDDLADEQLRASMMDEWLKAVLRKAAKSRHGKE